MNTVNKKLLLIIILSAATTANNVISAPKSPISCAQTFYPYALDAAHESEVDDIVTAQTPEPKDVAVDVEANPTTLTTPTSFTLAKALGLEKAKELEEIPTIKNTITSKLKGWGYALATSSNKRLMALAVPVLALIGKSIIIQALKSPESKWAEKIGPENLLKITKQTLHNPVVRDLVAHMGSEAVAQLAKAGITKLSRLA
ncbi:hypothetical protein FJ366_00940 [Candidatus Dependentiae bacterium]|nr:hypothetical protein [Candidatus Dependentiae bacterium]